MLVAVLLAIGAPCGAATIVVDPGGGGDFTEIQPAIDAAADGDTVLVKSGEYVITEPIDFNSLHDPDDPASPPVKDILPSSSRNTLPGNCTTISDWKRTEF